LNFNIDTCLPDFIHSLVTSLLYSIYCSFHFFLNFCEFPHGCGGHLPEFGRWVEFPPLPNWQFVRGDKRCYVPSLLQGHAAVKIPSHEKPIKGVTVYTTCLHMTCCNRLALCGNRNRRRRIRSATYGLYNPNDDSLQHCYLLFQHSKIF